MDVHNQLFERLKELEELKRRVFKTGSTRDVRHEIKVRGRNGSTYYRFISMETLLCCIKLGEAKMNPDNIPQSISSPWDKIS
jgi:hypothetical protein